MRYFIAFYKYKGWDKRTFALTGEGNISIQTKDNHFLNAKETALHIAEKAGLDTTRKYDVVLTNIIELSEQDYFYFMEG